MIQRAPAEYLKRLCDGILIFITIPLIIAIQYPLSDPFWKRNTKLRSQCNEILTLTLSLPADTWEDFHIKSP